MLKIFQFIQKIYWRSKKNRGRVLIVSCEHAGNKIPKEYRNYFKLYKKILETHNALDIGAKKLAKKIARAFGAPLFLNLISRLLIDVDCSLHNKPYLFFAPSDAGSEEKTNQFKEAFKDFPEIEKEQIIKKIYEKHRQKLEKQIADEIKNSRGVFHLMVHSFTPNFKGEERNADIGLLYNPALSDEAELCQKWQKILIELDSNLKVRLNYPYTGSEDGLTSNLRRQFGEKYLGVEIEVNQKWPTGDKRKWKRLQKIIVKSLKILLK
ncbi:MAG: N-formylglutamate amidohydrolase [Patescibacteria group bacterium]|nr:N-formylglutamate amidohydrolase [Patescibacteria group bacterium]